MNFRHVFSWKSWFYHAWLPILRRFGPTACDLALGSAGRMVSASNSGRRRGISEAVSRANRVLRAGWDEPSVCRAVAVNLARYSARDYPLDGLADDAVLARFDVIGAEHLDEARSQGRGVVLVGGHLGAHVPALHWLDRRGGSTRFLVQRPNHVSRDLHRRFDRVEDHPQASFFLKRAMTPAESIDRLLRARSALRDGLAVYLSGDVPWPGSNGRRGRLLGVDRTFLAVWADLASCSRAPVVFVFAAHRPGGRYALTFDPPRAVPPGGEDLAVSAYLRRLEAEIIAHPADAVAYLLWPCFGPPSLAVAGDRARVGRRVSVAAGSSGSLIAGSGS